MGEGEGFATAQQEAARLALLAVLLHQRPDDLRAEIRAWIGDRALSMAMCIEDGISMAKAGRRVPWG